MGHSGTRRGAQSCEGRGPVLGAVDPGPWAFIAFVGVFLLLPTIYGMWRAAVHVNHGSHRVLAWAMAVLIGCAGVATFVADAVLATRHVPATQCREFQD